MARAVAARAARFAARQLLLAVLILALASCFFILLSLCAYGRVRWGF